MIQNCDKITSKFCYKLVCFPLLCTLIKNDYHTYFLRNDVVLKFEHLSARSLSYVVESVTLSLLARQLLFDKTFCLRGVSVMISANAQAIREEVPVF